jgi:hypothetical protein
MTGRSSRISIRNDCAQRVSLQHDVSQRAIVPDWMRCVVILAAMLMSGCGKTVRNTATEQLILSDSVDRAIRSIDFSPLAGRACYFDTQFVNTTKSASFVNADYVLSSIRNQLVSAGGVLVDSQKEADVVIEPRLGVLGANENEVTYGIPSSNIISQAAAIMPTAPPVPSIPEISFARKNYQMATTKLAVFAYDAKSGHPVWQSGVATARSNSRDTWLFGVGPFQSGTIYEKPRFAGARITLPLIGDKAKSTNRQTISHDQEFVFAQPPALLPAPEDAVQHASAETPAPKSAPEKPAVAEKPVAKEKPAADPDKAKK